MTATLRRESPPLDEIIGGADTQEPSLPIEEIEEPLDEATSGVDTQRPKSLAQTIMGPLKEVGAIVDTAPQEPMSNVEQEDKLEEAQAEK